MEGLCEFGSVIRKTASVCARNWAHYQRKIILNLTFNNEMANSSGRLRILKAYYHQRNILRNIQEWGKPINCKSRLEFNYILKWIRLSYLIRSVECF